MDDRGLTLPEQILLLTLKERDGSLLDSTRYRFAIAGAILAELRLRGYIELDTGSSERLVTVLRPERTGDPVLDDALSQIVTAHRRGGADRWVGRLAESEELHLRVARQLCRKRALDEHEGRVRLIFRRTVYVKLDEKVERLVTERVREGAFGDGPLDIRTALVTGLAHAGDILTAVFDADAVLSRLEQIHGVMTRVEVGEPADEQLRDAAAALVAATDAAVLQAGATAA
jgi:hypothetical protein